jgi:hypothetical protein
MFNNKKKYSLGNTINITYCPASQKYIDLISIYKEVMPKQHKTTTSKANKPKSSRSEKKKKGSVKVNTETALKLKNNKSDLSSEKKSRLAGVKKGDAPNAATAYIHGTFNVNLAKKDLRRYISNTLGYEMGTINAQYAYSALAEVLSLYLVSSTAKYNKKNTKKANLYEVSLENVQRAVRESNEYGANVKLWSENFNPTAMDYTSTFYDTPKTLRKFLEKNAFQNTTNVHINKDALNFVCYLMSLCLSELTRTACILSRFGNKKNVQIKNFSYAVEVHFSGELCELMTQRVSEIDNMFSNKSNNVEDEESEDNQNKKSEEN